jgi:hypothetical protein
MAWQALTAVATLPRLTHLDLFGARVTDAGLTRVCGMGTLTHLEVCGIA